MSAGRMVARRLLRPIVVFAGAMFVSSVGYVVIADYGWFDALYMTAITLGTVGFGEVKPLGTGGRLWTIGVILGGFALLVYAGSVLTGLLVSGEMAAAVRERRGRRMRDHLQDHVIIVGFGRVGRAVTTAVRRQDRPCAVIDLDPSLDGAIQGLGAVALTGDGIQEETLRLAGIERARALVAAATDDPTNLLIVLTAHALRPDLRIVARVNDAEWHDRIVRAGASVAISPYEDFGAGLAASAVNESILGVHALAGLNLASEEIVITAHSPFLGRSVEDVATTEPGVLILGIRRVPFGSEGKEAVNAEAVRQVSGPLRSGDIVLALGTKERIERLQRALYPEVAPRRH